MLVTKMSCYKIFLRDAVKCRWQSSFLCGSMYQKRRSPVHAGGHVKNWSKGQSRPSYRSARTLQRSLYQGKIGVNSSEIIKIHWRRDVWSTVCALSWCEHCLHWCRAVERVMGDYLMQSILLFSGHLKKYRKIIKQKCMVRFWLERWCKSVLW